MSATRAIWRERLPWLLLAIVFCVYAKCMSTFFVQDDFWFLRDSLKPFSSRLMLSGGLPDYMRPIPTFWLPLINRYLWGLSPFGFHISQMLCLLATVYALYHITFRLTQSSIAASVTAVVYGLSKIHLWNVCWVAGGIDTSAGCFMTLTLLAIVRYQQGEGSLWAIGAACAAALLSKESAIIVVVAWGGSVAVRAVLPKLLPRGTGVPQPAVGSPQLARESVGEAGTPGRSLVRAVAGRFTRQEIRIALVLAGILIAYAILRMNMIHTRPELGLDFSRFKYLIKSSIVAILPIVVEPSMPISKTWILLPLAIGAGALLLRPAHKAHEAVLGLLLWLSHAAIFAVSVQMPPLLQLYYAHFNLIGLALLAGLCCAGLIERCSWRWLAVPVQVAVVLLLGAYGYRSAAVVREGIENANSTPLYTARYSLKAYEQLRYWLGGHPYRTVVFLHASNEMWWAMGLGDMFISMFPGVEAHFDGMLGYQAPAGIRTDEATLVVQQVSEFDFEVVR